LSVRDGLLAILTLGPAYGAQLHAELVARAPHRAPLNLGQVYQTLDRLAARGLTETAGVTDDGLPLHRITEEGSRAAHRWLAEPDDRPDWTETLDRVLLASSLDDATARRLIDLYRARWIAVADAEHEVGTPQRGLATVARRELARAAISWLEEAEDVVHQEITVRPYASTRPRRGRPSATHFASE